MPETFDEKPNYIKYEGKDFFTARGVYQDAKNIWSPIAGILVSLSVAERGGKKDRIADLMVRLNAPRQTYEEYLLQRYSESDLQEILAMSNPTTIAENDSLVGEWNQLASAGQMTPEIAKEFMGKGVGIFSG